MKKVMLSGAALLGLTACSEKKDVIVCGDYEVEMTLSEDGEMLDAVINGDEMTLNLAISAFGARYVGELNETIVTLWNKGSDWTMFLNDGAPIMCVAK